MIIPINNERKSSFIEIEFKLRRMLLNYYYCKIIKFYMIYKSNNYRF